MGVKKEKTSNDESIVNDSDALSGDGPENETSRIHSSRYTTMGNAALFAAQHRNSVRYCPEQKCWYVSVISG